MFGSLHDVFFAFGACWGLDMFHPESLGSMAEFPAVSSVVDQLSGARQPITYGSHGIWGFPSHEASGGLQLQETKQGLGRGA